MDAEASQGGRCIIKRVHLGVHARLRCGARQAGGARRAEAERHHAGVLRALSRPDPPRIERDRHHLDAQGAIETGKARAQRSEEHTSELQSLMRISYAVFCLKKKNVEYKDQQMITMSTQIRRANN